ncbi:MAG: AAA family ATPase [Bacilli bacterium]|nr:AAA family ATPase [Bacilli bacterium]
MSGRGKNDVLEVEYGYYPQNAVAKNMQIELESALNRGQLNKTGNKYTTDSRRYNEYDTTFQKQHHEEYEYKGKRFVRVKANSFFGDQEFTLSNKEKYKDGSYVWIEVKPIKWLVDEKAHIMLAEQLIFSGVQFNRTRNYHTSDWENTDIKEFMDKYLSKDIVQNINLSYIETEQLKPRQSRLQKLNPDTTKQSQRRRMTDTEIIHSWIEAGQSVLLRGPSGIGKTDRLKTLYPDLIYIKLTNNMFPEKVVGSMNLQTGQSIPPDFAKEAILACSTEEERKLISENIQNIYNIADIVYERSKTSTKKIVIMLDELLNVKPAVQSLVYTLVLNKLVEIGKGLKLPANTVIVATGNQKKYSSVAEDLAEPLEKRFDHILDMEPRVGDWINEYAIPNNVHPAVISYIFSKYIQKNRSEAIEDIDYFYEEPEVGEKHIDQNGCNGRTNDPRGWVSISNTLYAFENDLKAGKFIGKDVEHLLQISIASKLRIEWAQEFYNFYNMPTLSVQEIVEKNYSESDLPRDINERFAYVSALLVADEKEVASCREFIKKYCDKEYLQLFDIYWMGNNEKRMELIAELEEMSLFNESTYMSNEGVGKRI